MSQWAIYSLVICIVLYTSIVVYESARSKNWKLLLLNLLLIFLFLLILNFTTGFPKYVISFGSVTPIFSIITLFLSTCFGIAAWYYRNTKKPNFLDLSKTLVISPIILIPMIGTVQGSSSIEAVQMFTLSLLAFQNGYFWKTILDRSKLKIEKRDD